MKNFTFIILLTVGSLCSLPSIAQDSSSGTESGSGSAMQDLINAEQDGQEAVNAESEEDAKVESGETFDTPHDSDGD